MWELNQLVTDMNKTRREQRSQARKAGKRGR